MFVEYPERDRQRKEKTWYRASQTKKNRVQLAPPIAQPAGNGKVKELGTKDQRRNHLERQQSCSKKRFPRWHLGIV
jgi:hypothetical protein